MKTYLFTKEERRLVLVISADDFEEAQKQLKLASLGIANWKYEGMNVDLNEFLKSKFKNGISIERKDFKVTGGPDQKILDDYEDIKKHGFVGSLQDYISYTKTYGNVQKRILEINNFDQLDTDQPF